MYLTRILIGHQDWHRRRLDNPNAWKGMLWHLFDHYSLPHNSGGYLFRVDKKGEYRIVLVVSGLAPNLKTIVGKDIEIKSKFISDSVFIRGAKYRFFTRVNPVITRNSRREPYSNKDIPNWISKQMGDAARCCFCKIENVGVQWCLKDNMAIPQHSVDISGLLEVSDPKKFVDLICKGIGKSRRYGFGMISIST